jgi:hypothetical protein
MFCTNLLSKVLLKQLFSQRFPIMIFLLSVHMWSLGNRGTIPQALIVQSFIFNWEKLKSELMVMVFVVLIPNASRKVEGRKSWPPPPSLPQCYSGCAGRRCQEIVYKQNKLKRSPTQV